MSRNILLISPRAEAESCAASLAQALACAVGVAATHRAGLAALRRREYSVVVIDDCLVETNPGGADLLLGNCGLAMPLQVNFAICGGARLARDVRAAIARREREEALARRAAASLLESELKTTVTGLLLQSQLALAEPALPARLSEKLKVMADLAGSLRQILERAQERVQPIPA